MFVQENVETRGFTIPLDLNDGNLTFKIDIASLTSNELNKVTLEFYNCMFN